MVKQKINMVGGGFQHDVCSSSGSVPKLIEWVKGVRNAPISIYIDYSIKNVSDKSKKCYAWLSESRTINSDLYEWCINHVDHLENNFELIFTHDERMLHLSDKFKMVICNARPWVKNCGVHNKTKLVSMIASNKNMCKEHSYRQEIARKYRNSLDLFGRGFNPIVNKEIGLNDYYFSVTMENGDYPLMYTEKIADCFATGTIPIYFGNERISEVFDSNGIIMLTKDFDLNTLTSDLYYSKIDSVIRNYNIIMDFPTAEDYIYEKYIK